MDYAALAGNGRESPVLTCPGCNIGPEEDDAILNIVWYALL